MLAKGLSLAPFVALLIATVSVEAQHCGGPCEVPRGVDPVSANPKYTLSEGIEKANWRYLFNWFWTENGEQKYRLETALSAPPLSDFGFRRMFVSPSGNGFLVTGNPYARKLELDDREPPLFVFCDPEGNRLTEIYLPHVLADSEQRLASCFNCNCCKDVLYIFAQDPSLSDNGCFVELMPYDAENGAISFYLPFGCLVRDRREFEAALEAAEWSNLSAEATEQNRKEIQSLLSDLGSDELLVRTIAGDALVTKGFLARSAIQEAQLESTSGNFRARANAVETRLRPLGGSDWEAMSNNLELLASMLSYPEKDVVHAVQMRLERILPAVKEMDADACATWIKSHRKDLKWNPAKGEYEE